MSQPDALAAKAERAVRRARTRLPFNLLCTRGCGQAFAWLRLWVAIPNAVAGIRPLQRDMLIVIDEMPRIGFLKPVMDGYTMAAGKGVHFWCFASPSRPSTRAGARSTAGSCCTSPRSGLPPHRRRRRGRALEGHRHCHLRGPDREQVGDDRREPRRHRQHSVAGGRVPHRQSRQLWRRHGTRPRPPVQAPPPRRLSRLRMATCSTSSASPPARARSASPSPRRAPSSPCCPRPSMPAPTHTTARRWRAPPAGAGRRRYRQHWGMPQS